MNLNLRKVCNIIFYLDIDEPKSKVFLTKKSFKANYSQTNIRNNNFTTNEIVSESGYSREPMDIDLTTSNSGLNSNLNRTNKKREAYTNQDNDFSSAQNRVDSFLRLNWEDLKNYLNNADNFINDFSSNYSLLLKKIMSNNDPKVINSFNESQLRELLVYYMSS